MRNLADRDRGSSDAAWATAARGWGLISGVAFAVATLADLVQVAGLIGSPPTYTPAAAGQLQDEATYWVALFAYRHDVLWDYVLRDGLVFVAFLGLIPVALALNVATGGRRAAVQIATAFIAVGAMFGASSAVALFVDVSWWRSTGWNQVPAPVMDAIGRSSEFMQDLSAWCRIASSAALVVGLLYLWRACLTEPALSRRIGWVAVVLAAVQATVIVAGDVGGLDSIANVLSLVSGIVLVPAIAIGLGLRLSAVLSRGRAGGVPIVVA